MSHWPSVTHLDRGAFSKACARSSAISELIAFPWMATISWNDSRWSCSMFLSKMDLQLFPQCFHSTSQYQHRWTWADLTLFCHAGRLLWTHLLRFVHSLLLPTSHQVTPGHSGRACCDLFGCALFQCSTLGSNLQNPCISMHVIFIINLHTDFDSNLA